MKGIAVFTCAVILLNAASVYSQNCPNGFMKHGEACYLFSILRVSWIQAMKFCEIYGGELAVIGSEEEQLWIESYLKSTWTTYNQTDGVWLGGADLLVENEWEWVAQQQPFTYSRWAPGEPSHYQRVGAAENCLDLLPHKQFMWNDESCAWKMNFLCKTSLLGDPLTVIGKRESD
ncbi:perlucin-like [Ostrea edulis]|uniref:perlucin-like n=1 Tax=Ostrea edulis TaxID=37623 RepID=UPI00209404A5|nr:perlucin-like [Ostrea edulis]